MKKIIEKGGENSNLFRKKILEDIFRRKRGEAEAIEEKERGDCGTRLLGTHASGRGLPTNVRKEPRAWSGAKRGWWMKEWKRRRTRPWDP